VGEEELKVNAQGNTRSPHFAALVQGKCPRTTGQARRNPPGSSLHCKPAEMMMSSIVGGGAVTQSGATECQKNHIASIGEVRVLYM